MHIFSKVYHTLLEDPKVILQHQATSFGTMSKASCTEHFLRSWLLKTVNFGVCSRAATEMLHVWTSFVTAGL